MERDAWSQGGGGGHLVPMGDSGGALLAGIGCVDERLGAGAAIPSGGTASNASVAAPAWRHVRPIGKYNALVRRRTQRCDLGRAVIGTIRAAASNDSHGPDPTDPWTRSDARRRPPRSRCASQIDSSAHSPLPARGHHRHLGAISLLISSISVARFPRATVFLGRSPP